MYTRISLLMLALAILVGAPSLLAWTSPTQPAPNGNVAAPVNTSGVTQYKNGNLAVNVGLAFSQFRSDQYCDINGNNCISTLGGGGGSSVSLTAGNGITLSPNPITAAGTISANTTQVQSRVTGTCPVGQAIRTINQNGTVVCQAVTTTASTCLYKGVTYSQGYSCVTGTSACSTGTRYNYMTCNSGTWQNLSTCTLGGSPYQWCP